MSKSNPNPYGVYPQATTQPYYGTPTTPAYGGMPGTTGAPAYGTPGVSGYGTQPVYPAPPTTAVSGAPFFQQPALPQMPGMLPLEESYIENILRLNKGKLATVYMSFDNGNNSKVFKGIIEAAGRDHLILSDPQTGMRYLLLMIFLNYVTFDEELEYDYPFATPGLVSYPPR